MDVSKARPQQVQETQAAQRNQDARETQQRQAQARAAETKKNDEPKRPVINSQGQTTGQLLNVTA